MRSRGTGQRVVLLDELRGLCLVLMVIYHGLYNLTFLFGVPIPFYSAPLNALQLFICCGFITLAGISCRFSRGNIKRGLFVFAVAMGMSLATWYFMPGQIILFGVLHMLGLCMVLYGIMNPAGKIDRVSGFLGLVVCLALFAVSWGVPKGHLGIFGLELFRLPAVLYSSPYTFFLGFPHSGFYSADYFPLLPWAFLFFAGAYIGTAFREGSTPWFFYRPRCRFLGRIGKHTLLIYILHQPVLYGLMYGVFYLIDKFK
ncbi:MAG: DUF1624 domain-containing protein [Oscillospiraceae bacterium]|nr:DUF1624 domain-containing protein [Oscillospiraceae bacterium]